MSDIFKCKSVQPKEGRNGTYYAVETMCNKKFNVFDGGEKLGAGVQFTCELEYVERNGKTYTNVVKDTFAVDMSTAYPQGHYQNPDPEKVTDKNRQSSIEAQNAFTNLTKMCCEFPLWTDPQRQKLADELVAYGKERMGL